MEFRDVRGLSGLTITPYRIVGGRPGTHAGLPSPTVTLVIDLGTGLTLSTDDDAPRTFRAALGGMHLRPVTIHHDGTQVGVQLDLAPAAVRTLFGLPPGELFGRNLALADLAPGLAGRLYDDLGAAEPDTRAARCAALLTAAPRYRAPADDDAARIWQFLARRRGRVTVAELVDRSGWSARKLSALFAAEYGMGLKQAARLFRFDHARRRLETGAPIAEVAADCGYADQAHLTREVHDFTGLPPAAFLAARAAEFAGATQS
nr:AraC family transcriptional regulator [Gordonia sp. (in: high G+C Gram-positive bacteria)]